MLAVKMELQGMVIV
jgi:hypothetical protein